MIMAPPQPSHIRNPPSGLAAGSLCGSGTIYPLRSLEGRRQSTQALFRRTGPVYERFVDSNLALIHFEMFNADLQSIFVALIAFVPRQTGRMEPWASHFRPLGAPSRRYDQNAR